GFLPARLRLPGLSSPSRERLADAAPFCRLIGERNSRSRRTLLSVVHPTILRAQPMPRHFLFAMSVSLVTFLTPAFAGPGDASNSAGVVQSGQTGPGIAPATQPAAPSGARFANDGQSEPLALASPV